jgi:predicted aspartyl protease
MWLLLPLAIVGGTALGLHALFPDTLRVESNRMSLVYYLVWMAVVASAIVLTFRQRWTEAIKHGVAWVLILLVLVATYGYRHEVEAIALRVAAGRLVLRL